MGVVPKRGRGSWVSWIFCRVQPWTCTAVLSLAGDDDSRIPAISGQGDRAVNEWSEILSEKRVYQADNA